MQELLHGSYGYRLATAPPQHHPPPPRPPTLFMFLSYSIALKIIVKQSAEIMEPLLMKHSRDDPDWISSCRS